MWLLMQLVEIVFVIAGLNVLWEIVKTPLALVHREKAPEPLDPDAMRALQKAALKDYSAKIRASLDARAASRG